MSTSQFSIVKLKNTWTRPMTFVAENGEKLIVQPGETRSLPLSLCYVAFGDINAFAHDVNRRREYYEQYRGAYSFYPGFDAETEAEKKDGFSSWEAKRPRYEAYDENGERLYFLLDDPFGELGLANKSAVMADVPFVDNTQAAIQRRLDAMEALNRELLAKLAAVLPSGAIDPTMFDRPADDDADDETTKPVITEQSRTSATDLQVIPAPKPNTGAVKDTPGSTRTK